MPLKSFFFSGFSVCNAIRAPSLQKDAPRFSPGLRRFACQKPQKFVFDLHCALFPQAQPQPTEVRFFLSFSFIFCLPLSILAIDPSTLLLRHTLPLPLLLTHDPHRNSHSVVFPPVVLVPPLQPFSYEAGVPFLLADY